jgi:hypothetical protein
MSHILEIDIGRREAYVGREEMRGKQREKGKEKKRIIE